jgi:signal transduction histidine kinase/CheY-like chemotaxis protein
MTTRLLTIEIRHERDVVFARQRTRQLGGLLGFDSQDQVRLATAVSEIARNAFLYAGGGRAEFAVDGRTLRVTVRDQGPGIANLPATPDGRQPLLAGTGLGLVGARRLMDEFAIESDTGSGTTVHMGKELPRHVPAPTGAVLARASAELAVTPADDPLTEVQRQNQELLRLLDDLRDREAAMAELNLELKATNRGVVALYAELEEKAGSLRRASELKTRFLSHMSHEFRTPLNSILSLSQFLIGRTDGPLTDEQERQVLFVRRAAQGLMELVNDLLDLAKVEAGKVVIRPEWFAATDLFAALRGLMRPLATSDAVGLVLEDAAGVGDLHTDEGKVSQILRNFVSNALKFTERGEVRVSAAVGPGDTVVFAVADTGIGIAPADQERVFEEFGQVDGPLQKKAKGTGLGLPLSRHLAELLGGGVSVRSEIGVGSTFTLSVPRVYPGAADGRNTGAERAQKPAPARATVLVIDDDEIARYLLRSLFEPGRFVVLEAASGEEGLRRAREERPHAIVLDLVMLDLSGFEVLERLKADSATRDIPVVIHSSRSLDAAERARLEGRAAFLPKGEVGSREAASQLVLAAILDATRLGRTEHA